VDLVQALYRGKSVRMRSNTEAGCRPTSVSARDGSFCGVREEKGVDVVYRVICWQDAGTFRVEPIRSFPRTCRSRPTTSSEGSRRLDEHQAGVDPVKCCSLHRLPDPVPSR
jgi:hypothetical protein